jgi:hypothetical protein
MNFLAHYYYDKIDNDPAHTLGLLLPDLVRNFGKPIHQLPDISTFTSFKEKSIAQGFLQHIQSDKIFHQTEGFVLFNKQIISLLRNSTIAFKRDWFLAHIFTELMLDRVILLRHPDLAENLYSELATIDESTIHSFFTAMNYTDPSNFFIGFNKFNQAAYLQSYIHPESVAFAMGKIAQKMDINISDASHKKVMVQIIESLENKMFTFMEDLSSALKVDQN